MQIGTLKAAMLDFVSKHALGNVETPVPPLREVQQESPSEGPADEEEKSAVSRKRVTLSSMNS